MSTASEIRFENAWQLTTLERMVVALMVVAILELAFNRALDESEHRILPLGDPPLAKGEFLDGSVPRSASRRKDRRLLHCAGRDGALHADGRSRRRGHQDRGPRYRRQFTRLDRHVRLSQ